MTDTQSLSLFLFTATEYYRTVQDLLNLPAPWDTCSWKVDKYFYENQNFYAPL